MALVNKSVINVFYFINKLGGKKIKVWHDTVRTRKLGKRNLRILKWSYAFKLSNEHETQKMWNVKRPM